MIPTTDPAAGATATAPTVLVTGATGFTGGALALALRRRGQAVRALVRNPEAPAAAALARAGVTLVPGDIRDQAAVVRAAAGCAAIYHIAAVFRTAGHPDSYYSDVNLGGTLNVLDAARRQGVDRVIHCSTIGVHGDVAVIPCDEDGPLAPLDIYQRTKLEGELAARDAFAKDLRGVVFRPAGIYGPGDLRFLKLFRAIARGRFVMIGDGRTLWHPVHIDDLVRGILLCGTVEAALGGVFILAGDRHVTLNELTATIARAVGREPPRLRVPYWPVQAAAAVCEAACRPFGIDPPLHRRRAAFFVKNRAFDITRARTILGYAPQVGLEQGVRETASWYAANGHLPAGAGPAAAADAA
ncbi:MAG: hypothetical protein RLY86_1904 [Pseudomonadota bacterium]|jgi:nucleoside-diphosphate-sugar epimerase